MDLRNEVLTRALGAMVARLKERDDNRSRHW